MATPSAIRTASAIALIALLVACGDKESTGPDARFAAPGLQFNAVELLITFTSDDPATTGSNPPSFSLSSVPASVLAGASWSRTIAVVPNSPFGVDMAVDYGDGSGARDLNVTQSNGQSSFTLSRTYATPGTYTVKVVAANYGDEVSTRFATATITVVPDPNLYIENFQIATPVIQGQPAAFSFDARGPAGPNYSVTLTYGTNLTQNAFVPANGSYSNSYAWPEPGAYELTATISNGDKTKTLTHTVVVEPAPIIISSFVGPVDVSFGNEASFSFEANGPGPGPYTATITYGDGSEATVIPINPGATVTRSHTWAESGLWPLNIVVTNGFTTATLTENVAIHRPKPTIDNLSIPDTLSFGEASALAFVPNDVSNVDEMDWQLLIRVNGGPFQTHQAPVTPGEQVELPLTAPHQNAVYDLKIVVRSAMNGLIAVSDTAYHTLTVEDLVCPAGSYRDGFTCVDAPAGAYVPEPGAYEAIPCPVGTYQNQAGQTSCIPAPAGSAVSLTGATQPQLCPVGTYQNQTGSATCKPAEPGRFVSQVGAVQATPCAPGTFQPAMGSSSCNTAAPGSFVATSGASQATLCPAGTYQPASGQTSCLPAPIGSYVDFNGATAASACPATTSTLAAGSTSASQCIRLGQIALITIDQAVGAGTLAPASSGNGGQRQFEAWISDLDRSFDFLDGPQRQAGCSHVRNALAQADGQPSPKDVITGPARAGVEAALRRILEDYGC